MALQHQNRKSKGKGNTHSSSSWYHGINMPAARFLARVTPRTARPLLAFLILTPVLALILTFVMLYKRYNTYVAQRMLCYTNISIVQIHDMKSMV